MSFALLIIGITLVVAAVRNTQNTLITLLQTDFTGANNFWYWIVALLAVGAIGYVPKLKPLSDGLIVIILLALILTRANPKAPRGGFFQQFTEALGTTTKTAGIKTTGTTAENQGPFITVTV